MAAVQVWTVRFVPVLLVLMMLAPHPVEAQGIRDLFKRDGGETDPVQQSLGEMNSRLNRMEDELRRLNGEIERLRFENDQLRRAQGLPPSRPRAAGPPPRPSDNPLPALRDAQRGSAPDAPPAPSGSNPFDLSRMSDPGAPPPTSPDSVLQPVPVGDGILVPANPSTSSLPVAEPVVRDPRADYDVAYGLILKRDYAQAEVAFGHFLANHANSSLAANGHFWLGEARFSQENYSGGSGILS